MFFPTPRASVAVTTFVACVVLAFVSCTSSDPAGTGGTGGMAETTGGRGTGGTGTGGIGTGGVGTGGFVADIGSGGVGAFGGTGGAQTGGAGATLTGGAGPCHVGSGGDGSGNLVASSGGMQGTGGLSTGGLGTGGAWVPARWCDTSCPSLTNLIQPSTTEAFRSLMTRTWRWCTASKPLFDTDQSFMSITSADKFVIQAPGYSLPQPAVLSGEIHYGPTGPTQVTFTASSGATFTTNGVLGTTINGVELILNSGPNQSVFVGFD